MKNTYKNKKVTIFGLGRTGLSLIDFFKNKKSNIRVIDFKNNPRYIDFVTRDIDVFLGENNNEIDNIIKSSDLLVISPGINIKLDKLNIARKLDIEILSDIDIFCKEISPLSNLIAVTGTNGKSTVVNLVYYMLKKHGLNVALGGNIGTPVLSLLNKKYDYYVLEMSSFQLENISNIFKTKTSSILNITQDHLDRHNNFEEYKNIKLKIFENSSNCIFNIDDINTYPLIKFNNSKYISFGQNKGDYFIKNINNNKFLFNKDENIINCSDIKINGMHNYINSLSSISITDTIGISRESQISVLKEFKGLNHRFQTISNKNNIEWINDSKSTNVDSTYIAVKNIINYKTLHLIIGGDKKSLDFSDLMKYLDSLKNIKIYCFGKDGEYIYNFIPEKSFLFETLKELFNFLIKNTKSGDVVLFSPGCSSLDQYKERGFEQRGDEFISLVNSIN
ncbi:UDP-N-acetylmuramoylalanine-D-glutamate ligase [endosymbiont of Sipalinus gigas]|uniref:UDP-N-acetylmuramoyl-L-alanine--D-glutamate ligase n=1 Tax=endosymbiont of Sipalinus gigas TaxID=1972134 RepID=UPI000DC72C99|nr:UDP-N-acetylmuramoyl-L-alanine--D-glutamate ligase [endosymbiont of Sipalinus gigas]BBA85176.1 UDP-N-acetylmuramoylalanine-D-glutamate ligase [endosymbiont of Sipalinus gigas]